MNYNWLLGLFWGIFVLSGNLFADEIVTQQQLRDTIERSLIVGDSARACLYYKRLNAELDSAAHEDYNKEVKSNRDIYQIDQLYLETQLQRQQMLQRSMLYSGIFILLLAGVIFYLRVKGKQLDRSRISAQNMKREAEGAMESKRRLLWSVSREMHDLLAEMNARLEELHSDKLNIWEKKELLEELKAKTDALQDLYERVCRKESEKE